MSKSIRVSDECYQLIEERRGELSQGQFIAQSVAGSSNTLAQLLEHVQGFPTIADVEFVVEATMRRVAAELRQERQQQPAAPPSGGFNPTSIPGIQVGAGNLRPPRRETGTERAMRERQERQDRAAALDPNAGDRDDIVRTDEFVGG